MKREYILEHLNCANCANKIEENFKKNPNYKDVVLDFSRKILYFESDAEVSVSLISEEIEKVESGIIVSEKTKGHTVHHHTSSHECDHDHDHGHSHGHSHSHSHGHGHGEGSNTIKIRLFLSLLLFGIGLFLGHHNIWARLLFVVAYIIIGYDILMRSFMRIRKGDFFDENFLMSIATLGAFSIGEFPEATAVMIFYQIGEYFQDRAVDKSRKSIAEKMDLRIEAVTVLENDTRVVKVPEAVAIDDIILLKPNEKLALDGVVYSGESYMQTSSITGESVPKRVVKDDVVLSGFINGQQEISVKVTERYENSTVSKILELVERASAKKAKTERFITKFARYYTPIVVLLSILISIFPPLILGEDFSTWLYRGLVFLVISCPCALVLSIPLGFFAGLGAAAKSGIVVKGGNHLEALGKAKTFIFDKTGTLTKGTFKIAMVSPAKDVDEKTLLNIAVMCESRSSHPIAKALVKDANIKVEEVVVDTFEEISGKGVKLVSKDTVYIVGSADLMRAHQIDVEDASDQYTRVYVAKNKRYMGCIALEDQLKDNAKEAVEKLFKNGISEVAIVSGDQESVVNSVASHLNIRNVYGGCLPQDKLDVVEKYIKNNAQGGVVFVGDGSNDAPVLAGADIGIAMGGVGTDAAIEASDMMLMEDDLSSLPKAVAISKKTMRIIYQNIVFALGFKVFVMILGIFGIASMWLAVFADVGVALLAVLNALRILNSKY